MSAVSGDDGSLAAALPPDLMASSGQETRTVPGVLVLSTPLVLRAIEHARENSVEGANAARKFAHNAGLSNRQCQLIWDGVALNSTPSVALYKETEVALCTAGIALDWGGWGYESLPKARIEEILDVFPRLDMKQRFTRAVCRIAEARPATTYGTSAQDFGERFVPGYQRPSTVDYLLAAPFKE